MSMASQSSRPPARGSLMDADFDLSMLGAALWRNRGKILRPTIVVALIAFAVVMLIPPKYLGESRVLVVGRDNVFLRPDVDRDTGDRGTVDLEAVTSQAQLILSRDLAVEVINKLKLNERPEFDPALGGVSLFKSLLGFIGLTKNPLTMTPEERVLDAYYDRLNVYPVEKSRVIVIDFLSENPELAARVANAIADAYLERQQLAKQEQVRGAGTWLAGEIEKLRKTVEADEAKVEAFRGKTNLLVGPNGTTLSAQQLGEMNAQLGAARTLKADAEAKAKLIRQMLKNGEEIQSSDVLNSELIRRLSEQRVTLRAQLAEQSVSLLDNHPRIKELRAQVADLDQQIRHEAEAVARSLENDSKLASARVDSQTAMLDQFKNQASSTNEQDVQLRALEREAKSQRDLLESYLAKYREATARDSIASAPPDARIISRASVSNVPAYPKKLPTVLIATFATFVVCCGVVVTREFLANPASDAVARPVRVARPLARTPDARTTPAAAAAAATARTHEVPPAVASRLAARLAAVVKGRRPSGVPVSALGEFAHNLNSAETNGSQIAFFGVAPHLGTSGIAIKFARALAQESRVVLVGLGGGDAAIRAISGDPSAPGLAELADGEASFGDIITKDRMSGLNLIASGRAPATPGELVAAPGMIKNFKALAYTYGHVVIDVGTVDGIDLPSIAQLASHAILLVETLSNLGTDKARDRLEAAGFNDVTILVAGRPDAAAPGATASATSPATAAA
jgi:succinoglycan biosynthesis transport protein ExoP